MNSSSPSPPTPEVIEEDDDGGTMDIAKGQSPDPPPEEKSVDAKTVVATTPEVSECQKGNDTSIDDKDKYLSGDDSMSSTSSSSSSSSSSVELLDEDGVEPKSKFVLDPLIAENEVDDKDELDEGEERGDTGSDDDVLEDDEEDTRINDENSVHSSLLATSEIDNNSVDSIEVLDDDVMEIPKEDPLADDREPIRLKTSEILEIDEDEDVNPNSIQSSFNATSELDGSDGDSSIEEVDDDGEPSNAILVSDAKSLAELAASPTTSTHIGSTIININTPAISKKDNNKQPTLVIIDTNSILSGMGPIPIQKPTVSSSTVSKDDGEAGKSASKSEILLAPTNKTGTINIPDDSFLIEAPSFIVPYVFEQTGEKALKSFLKEVEEEIKREKAANDDSDAEDEIPPPKKKSDDYFESPVGKLLYNLGMSLVQEYVQVDFLKQLRRKADKERAKSRSGVPNIQTQQNIISVKNKIVDSKEENEPFTFPLRKCVNCNYKTESQLVLSTHLETPHMRHNCYRCNFCKHTTKFPHEILLHMEMDHMIRPRLERAPAHHQCPHCSFEDNSKTKLTRHIVSCTKRFRLEKNLEPPLDWDTPGKLPKMPKNRMMNQGTFNSPQGFVNTPQHQSQRSLLVHYPTMSSIGNNKYLQQGIRMQMPPLLQAPKAKPLPGLIRTNPALLNPINKVNSLNRGIVMRTASGQQVLTQPQVIGGQIVHQVIGGQLGVGTTTSNKYMSGTGMSNMSNQRSASQGLRSNPSGAGGNGKNAQTPSISITPLPRQSAIPAPAIASQIKPAGKTSFVICEICDGYIKDLDQLRNHMQWIHKVKIHPKMIYNKPPLNCQKCQFRFFTDQGLERHLLGSHGLVTSSMQEAANKGQDNGRCPLCGKVYQWKLLAHVAKDHNVTLKPAHLSYKCTVCTATFGMYKLFESHVYSAHSMNAKRNNPNATGNPSRSIPQGVSRAQITQRSVVAAGGSTNNYKPLKINDEITIIPQPLAAASPLRTKGSLTITPHTGNTVNRRSGRANGGDEGIEIIEIDEATNGRGRENGEYRTKDLRKRNLEISVCGTDSENSEDSFHRAPAAKRIRGN